LARLRISSGFPPSYKSVINTSTQQVIATIGVGHEPQGVAVSPDGSHIYIDNGGDGTVTVLEFGSV